ncbi:peptidase M61 [Alishewanella longhuensis]|uniref:Peptidase M61 n=1 Tax=Alishewanella longhuensis TaxID=1091037 RepID=A0ABQ3L0R2_9ALTE|nr:M61 family metallopeptidase [Alishewanella longhuensis]GHG74541.1 peptidase M61 [Alishewanella longhuensis]
MSVVHYQLNIADLSSRTLLVKLSFIPQQPVHQLQLPAWIPGSYMIRNFARHITHIRAYDVNGELSLLQLDKQSWQLCCGQQPVTIEYQIYANDLSVRAAYIDDEVAVLNPTCVCLEVSELSELPQQIEFKEHEAQVKRVTKNWRIATALPRLSGEQLSCQGIFQAANYQQLIDSPIIAGIFSLQQFNLDGVPHYIVVTGQNIFDEARLLADVSKLCQAQRDVFAALPEDLNQYWFLLWVTESGYGGLEHQFSTLLLCNRHDLPIPALAEQDESYHTLLGLFSHEYFHTWWVKRLKPVNFHPYRLDKEQYSRQLWMYEGFTSYFDDLALVKAGVISQQQYLKGLEKLISRVTRNPSEQVQSLTDSSFTAWTKFYLQDENAVNSIVSYYAKGALVALILDAELQQHGHSLAALCKALYQQYLITGTADESIFILLKSWQLPELAKELNSWVNQAGRLPLSTGLAKLGLTLNWRSPQQFDDLSGSTDKTAVASLGCSLKYQANNVFIHQLYVGSAAHQAGLMSGDQLLALAGYKITEHSLPQLLKRLPIDSAQSLVIFRKDRLLTLTLPLQTAKPNVAMLSVRDNKKVETWLNA